MHPADPIHIYNERIKALQSLRQQLLKKKSLLSWLRFLALVSSIVLLWQLWSVNILLAFLAFATCFGLFLFAVVKDLANKEALANNRILTDLNHQELRIQDHHYTDLPDGLELKPTHHPYANDLDIFGKASLFQYTNRAHSEQARQLYAHWLCHAADVPTILQRQDAAKELTGQLPWMQQLNAYGVTSPVTLLAEKKISDWLTTKNKFLHKLPWTIARFILPLASLSVLVLYLNDTLSTNNFTSLLVLFLIIAYSITRIITPQYIHLNKIVPELETLQNSIRWIEQQSFTSPLLNQLKNNLSNDRSKASVTIKGLKNILERFDYRLNPLVHIPLNIFFLWDLQQIIALENWKTRNTHNIAVWFKTLSTTEALVNLGTLSFNHPGWTYPVFTNEKGVFVADEIGHPLIPASQSVLNSFSTRGEKQLNLITGSNMAGKSTFLRTVGVNLVLAMAGAPVSGRKLLLSPMKVVSTMRVSDNLEENTSTFYAELKKLKEIIEAVNAHEEVFLLLDEILRGTNSADRHTGSKALITQLVKEKAVGLIATHDLELAKLADTFPGYVHNYHFDVQVKDEELYFDYKIKEGICTSMNASLLMKKIGIEL